MVKNQGNNLAIFGPFLDLQNFFQKSRVNIEASDFNLCDVFNKLFHLIKKFGKNNQILKRYFEKNPKK